MSKQIEALKLAEEALSFYVEDFDCAADRQALAAIREALAEPVCEHRIADARNEFVRDGYICIKCGALFRAADHAEPVKQEHTEQYWLHEINNARADGYERGYMAAKKLYADPVKQEPVAEVVLCEQRAGFGRTEERKDIKFLSDVEVGTLLYAAPVNAKAIRAEALKESARFAYYVRKGALEEAAKWLKESGLIGSNDCAAAIRGLK